MLGQRRSDDGLLPDQHNSFAGIDDGRDALQVLVQDPANFVNHRLLRLAPSASFSSADEQVVFPPLATSAAALSQHQLHPSQGLWSQSAFMPNDNFGYSTPNDICSTPHIFTALGDTSLGLFPQSASHELPFQMSQGQADSQRYYTTSGTYGDSQAASYQHYANSQVSPTTLMPYNSQPIPYHANTQPQFSSQLQMDSTTLAFTMGQQTVARVKRCSNCQTTETPTWRRHVKTQAQVCNACGLYYKLHGRDREFTLNSHGKKTVKRQPRGSGARAQRSRGFANTLELTSQAPVAHPHMVMTDVEYVSVAEYDMATQSTHRIPSPPNEYPGHTH